MSFLDKLERTFGRFAITHLALYLIIGQVAYVLCAMLQVVDPMRLIYWPGGVIMGEWWRLFTFLFVVPIPSASNLLGFVFLVFGWSIFYMMGNALEGQWGAFRFNMFLFTAYLFTIILSFLTPRYPVENTFILGSVFIAFAYLYPNFEFTLFFVLPVKVKWLALISILFGGYRFVTEGLSTKLQIGAAVAAFALFFGAEILRSLKQGQRTRARRAEREAEAEQPRHVCFVCGKNDKTHPDLDFRYCSQCDGDQCYCPEHIQNHKHVTASDDKKAE